ncbi:hypothetical protein Bca101_075441 [Brassica carinata]
MEDKQKEIIGIDDSQLSGGVDINLSLAQSSATSYTISHEVIDEFDNHQPSLRIWLVPEREKSKETEASFPQAWSMIDFPNVKTSLDEAEKMFFKGSALRLVRLIDYFESAFSGVSFASEDISKDPLSSTLDVSIFPELALVLRCHHEILLMNFRALNEIHRWYQEKGVLHEKRFHDVALSITLGSTNGSECTTSSVDMLSPQHTTTTNGFARSTLKPPKNLYFIICKKLCFLSELNSTPAPSPSLAVCGVESGGAASKRLKLWKRAQIWVLPFHDFARGR